MGRNAYRVVKIERKFSFSITNHPDLAKLLLRNSFHDSLSNEGSGTIEIEVDLLEEILSELVNPEKDLVKAIEKDIWWARRNKRDILTYQIF